MMEAGVYELQVQGAGALALAEEPTIALLVADEARVQWWGLRLESALSGSRSGHGAHNALIQPWGSVLPVEERTGRHCCQPCWIRRSRPGTRRR